MQNYLANVFELHRVRFFRELRQVKKYCSESPHDLRTSSTFIQFLIYFSPTRIQFLHSFAICLIFICIPRSSKVIIMNYNKLKCFVGFSLRQSIFKTCLPEPFFFIFPKVLNVNYRTDSELRLILVYPKAILMLRIFWFV